MIDNDKSSRIFERNDAKVFVTVRDNNVDQALRVLKKKMQREQIPKRKLCLNKY